MMMMKKMMQIICKLNVPVNVSVSFIISLRSAYWTPCIYCLVANSVLNQGQSVVELIATLIETVWILFERRLEKSICNLTHSKLKTMR